VLFACSDGGKSRRAAVRRTNARNSGGQTVFSYVLRSSYDILRAFLRRLADWCAYDERFGTTTRTGTSLPQPWYRTPPPVIFSWQVERMLGNQISLLEGRAEEQESKSLKHRQLAKQANLRSDRKVALHELRQSKHYEKAGLVCRRQADALQVRRGYLRR